MELQNRVTKASLAWVLSNIALWIKNTFNKCIDLIPLFPHSFSNKNLKWPLVSLFKWGKMYFTNHGIESLFPLDTSHFFGNPCSFFRNSLNAKFSTVAVEVHSNCELSESKLTRPGIYLHWYGYTQTPWSTGLQLWECLLSIIKYNEATHIPGRKSCPNNWGTSPSERPAMLRKGNVP